jgi:D-alanyl-D-alanine carboxypeptidase
MRWRYGDTNPVVAAVDAATVVEIGDLLWQDGDDAKPAAAQADQGTKTANQELLADKFLGVAMQRSRAGESEPIRVAASGVFEFDCPSAAFELGDLVGVDENAAGTALLNQQVAKVAQSKYAIGRVARREPAATTRVLVAVCSTVMTGGVEGSSPAGV